MGEGVLEYEGTAFQTPEGRRLPVHVGGGWGPELLGQLSCGLCSRTEGSDPSDPCSSRHHSVQKIIALLI